MLADTVKTFGLFYQTKDEFRPDFADSKHGHTQECYMY